MRLINQQEKSNKDFINLFHNPYCYSNNKLNCNNDIILDSSLPKFYNKKLNYGLSSLINNLLITEKEIIEVNSINKIKLSDYWFLYESIPNEGTNSLKKLINFLIANIFNKIDLITKSGYIIYSIIVVY